MYFSNFPTTAYKISETEYTLATDFIKAIEIDPLLKSDSLFSDPYELKDNETPEIISHKFYGSVDYHWVIMLINEKFDPFNDFPKSDDIVQKDTIRKFGNLEGIHHYEDASGKIINIYHLLNWENIIYYQGQYMNPFFRGLLGASVGEEPYSSLFKETFNGRMLGDINNSGSVSITDATIVRYGISSITNSEYLNYIIGDFTHVMTSDPVKYSDYLIQINENNNDVIIPVTNYEYMTRMNEEKRSIKILKKEILPEFVQRYLELIKA